MTYLCPSVLVPVLRALEWALNRTAVYVYDRAGKRELKLAYRTRSGFLAAKHGFLLYLLLPDGNVAGVSWKHSWEPVFQRNQMKQQKGKE